VTCSGAAVKGGGVKKSEAVYWMRDIAYGLRIDGYPKKAERCDAIAAAIESGEWETEEGAKQNIVTNAHIYQSGGAVIIPPRTNRP
jgi:hypothetical protein